MTDIVHEWHFLVRDVERQSVFERERPLEKGNAEHVNGNAAGPKLERAVRRPFFSDIIGQIAVLNDLQPIVDYRKAPEPVLWSLLGNCHRRELRIREQVIADEF